MRFDVEIVHLDGPALLIDAQDVLGRPREVGAQKILRVCIPMVPLTDEDTDRKRQAMEFAVALPYEVRALPLVCSGQLHALIPLMPERLGPLGEFLVIQLPIRLESAHHMPALPATAFQQAIGGIPTLKEPIDLEARGQQPLSLGKHLVGQGRLLAKAQPLRRSTVAVEPSHRLVTEVEAPIIRIGSLPEFQADFHMDGPVRVDRFLGALTLGVVMMLFDGFEMPRALIFFAQRVIQADIEGPLAALRGIGHQVLHNKLAHRRP